MKSINQTLLSKKKALICTTLSGFVLFGNLSPAAILPVEQPYVQAASAAKGTPYKTLFNGKEVNLGVNVQLRDTGFMIPLRGVFERLGGKVTTAKGTKVTVKSGSKVLTLTRGSNKADINGQQFYMAARVETINGVTMVDELALINLFQNVKITSSSANKKINFTIEKKAPVTVSEKGLPSRAKKQNAYGYGMNVYYGNHTYASKNQAEYDAVMNVVEKAISDVDFTKLDPSNVYDKALLRYLDGERSIINRDNAHEISLRDEDDIRLFYAGEFIGPLVANGVSKEEIIKIVNLQRIVSKFTGDANKADDNRLNSAYDTLILGKIDCDTRAQTESAFYDRMGYSTALVLTPNHAESIVKINGKWYQPGGFFQETTVTDLSFNDPNSRFDLTFPTDYIEYISI